jgi:hypothetical protein
MLVGRMQPNVALAWVSIALGALAGAASIGHSAMRLWNWAFRTFFAPLRAKIRENLSEHGLLMLCLSEEMPAQFEKLKSLSQSYGKTRARNWNELKRGSMQERLQWLIENYYVICQFLKLEAGMPAFNRLQRQLSWLFALPFGLYALVLGVAIALHRANQADQLLAIGMGVAFGLSILPVIYLLTIYQLPMLALTAELLDSLGQLDSPLDPLPEAEQELAQEESVPGEGLDGLAALPAQRPTGVNE